MEEYVDIQQVDEAKRYYIVFAITVLSSFAMGCIAGFMFWRYAIADFEALLIHTSKPHRAVTSIAVTPTKIASPSATLSPTKAPTEWGSATAEYLQQTFGKDAPTALQIAKEHHLNCQYGKDTRYVGLFAIDTVSEGLTQAQALDCYANIDAAKKIYDREKFKPWGK